GHPRQQSTVGQQRLLGGGVRQPQLLAGGHPHRVLLRQPGRRRWPQRVALVVVLHVLPVRRRPAGAALPLGALHRVLRHLAERSEERRVGKEGRSTVAPSQWTIKMTEPTICSNALAP